MLETKTNIRFNMINKIKINMEKIITIKNIIPKFLIKKINLFKSLILQLNKLLLFYFLSNLTIYSGVVFKYI